MRSHLVEGRACVDIQDLIEHLRTCQESVAAFCPETPATSIVVDTIGVTVSTLETLNGDAA